MEVLEKHAEPWRVTLIDTGDDTMIGGRIKKILPYIGQDEAFCVTYGDGVSDVNISESIAFHLREGRLATVTATQPPGRYGAINFEGTRVSGFQEKPRGDGGWINGGFFVLSPKIGDYIEGDATVWEKEPMMNLAKDGQMSVFFHDGFWHPMDTLRDKRYLEDLWLSNKAPWKKW
jgi:glucose-1-phosphate cytidylyltransferase